MTTSYHQLWPRERKMLERTHEYATVKIDHRRRIDWPLVLAMLALLLALMFLIDVMFHLSPIAIAADGSDYRQVHTPAEACFWVKMHPGQLANPKMIKKYCNSYGKEKVRGFE